MLSRDDVIERLRIACQEAGSQGLWAKAHGVPKSYVCRVLSGKYQPTEAVLEPLGLTRGFVYFEKDKT